MSNNNTNRSAGRNPTSSYGFAQISGSAAVHQGNTDIVVDNCNTIHANTFIQQIYLPFEVPTQGTVIHSSAGGGRLRPTLNTSHIHTHESHRGRPQGRGGTNLLCCGSEHDSPNHPSSASPGSVSASRSPSSTRLPRPSFPHRRPRRSSLSRHSSRSDISTPVSTTATSVTSVFSVQEREKRLSDCNEEQLSPKKVPSSDLNKPLPWTGHALNPHDQGHDTSPSDSGIKMDDNAPPAGDESEPPGKRRWADWSVPELYRLVRLALNEVEGRHARNDGSKGGSIS